MVSARKSIGTIKGLSWTRRYWRKVGVLCPWYPSSTIPLLDLLMMALVWWNWEPSMFHYDNWNCRRKALRKISLSVCFPIAVSIRNRLCRTDEEIHFCGAHSIESNCHTVHSNNRDHTFSIFATCTRWWVCSCSIPVGSDRIGSGV